MCRAGNSHPEITNLEQPRDIALVITVDTKCRRHLGQAWHCHDIARIDYYKACTRGKFHIAHCYLEILGRAELSRVI